MSRLVQCPILGSEAEGLERQPYPGTLGKRIFDTVSKEGWQRWLRQQTMFINEYRLSLINPKDRKFLEEEMEKFFFGQGAAKVAGYTPPAQ